MTILMATGLAARIVQVLKDFLPAQLDLIDTAAADSETTPDVSASLGYHVVERRPMVDFPAIEVLTLGATPVELLSKGHGSRLAGDYQVTLLIHVHLRDADDDAAILRRHLDAYVAGVMTVLGILHEGLDTTGDPMRFTEQVDWVGTVNYGPEPDQAEGQLVRTATVPLTLRRREV